MAILGKTAKIHPKVVTRKIVSPYHKRTEPRAFAWMQTEATHRAGTPVNRSQVAQDTTHT